MSDLMRTRFHQSPRSGNLLGFWPRSNIHRRAVFFGILSLKLCIPSLRLILKFYCENNIKFKYRCILGNAVDSFVNVTIWKQLNNITQNFIVKRNIQNYKKKKLHGELAKRLMFRIVSSYNFTNSWIYRLHHRKRKEHTGKNIGLIITVKES